MSGVAAACARSLKRLRVNCLDLYLLHWPGATPIQETVEAFERLKEAGKIRAWGVSNFDVDEMETVAAGLRGPNQVLYNLGARGIEFDLLPWCQKAGDAGDGVFAGGAGRAVAERHPALKAVAARHGATAAQVALAWTLRGPGGGDDPEGGDGGACAGERGGKRRSRSARRISQRWMRPFKPPGRKQGLWRCCKLGNEGETGQRCIGHTNILIVGGVFGEIGLSEAQVSEMARQ